MASKMKKKIIAVICVFALVLSLPMLAWAVPSSENNQATSSDGVVLNVSAGSGTIDSVAEATTQASNVPATLPATQEVLASFEVKGDATDVDLTFNVGAQWAGYKVTVYIQHDNGDPEVRSGVTVAANGTLNIHVDRLSVFTLVVDKTSAPASDGTKTDTGATSPKTGVEVGATAGVVAGVTIAMALAAAFVAVALRKKVMQ
ncbi:MAG: hypothetical protein LBC35_06590 [Coriobacteriales bacterium]|jgi:hypothetical protein|nr:hypothetical protein [Coriobacteriales bacterium]